MSRPRRITSRFFQDFGGLVKKLGFSLGVVAAIAGLGIALALPLWYFSNNYRSAYSIFVLVLLAAMLIFLLIRRLIRLSRLAGGLGRYAKTAVLPILVKIAVILATGAVAYGILLLVSRGRPVVSILAALVWLLFLGFLKYGRRGKT